MSSSRRGHSSLPDDRQCSVNRRHPCWHALYNASIHWVPAKSDRWIEIKKFRTRWTNSCKHGSVSGPWYSWNIWHRVRYWLLVAYASAGLVKDTVCGTGVKNGTTCGMFCLT
ncbi:DNA primase small subunit [Trichinella spiralis]|uniref:DNA primase small subunit n=1 Tax=Trichinella spiralis TaxID=6334 RepID=A0ABR3KL75_TRISP